MSAVAPQLEDDPCVPAARELLQSIGRIELGIGRQGGVIMKRTISSLFAIPAVLALAIVAAAATSARAQDASTDASGWQTLPPEAPVAQPDKKAPPLQLAGCWSGEIDDDTTGVGTGYAYIVQKGKRLKRGTHIGFRFNGGPDQSHAIKGSVNSRTFKLRFQRSTCVVSVHGTIAPSGDAIGSYRLTKRCLGQKYAGMFDFTYDPTNTTCQ
jgi:hypothetical protein